MINPFGLASVYIPADQLALAALFGALLAGVIVGVASIIVEELRA